MNKNFFMSFLLIMLVLLFNYTLYTLLVRLTGLEPAHRKTLDPKSSASTNFATDATIVFAYRLNIFILYLSYLWQR